MWRYPVAVVVLVFTGLLATWLRDAGAGEVTSTVVALLPSFVVVGALWPVRFGLKEPPRE
jgi:hypothetical protein